jgi:hypothetical protein
VITWNVQRPARDGRGRVEGLVQVAMWLEDGSPAKAAFTLNYAPLRTSLFAMSWDADTLMIRTAMARRGLSGAVERFWLIEGGQALAGRTTQFGYEENRELADTLWRQK